MNEPNYAAYLPGGTLAEAWGVAVNAAGHTRIRPHEPYPPGPHPADHALSWTTGRVLQAYQVIYITQGEGHFESAVTHRTQIRGATAFLLFPGVWHRYAPKADTGWVEDWIELNGPAVDRLVKRRVITPTAPVFSIGVQPHIVDLFQQCHALVKASPTGYQPLLGVLGLQIMARLVFADISSTPPTEADENIRRAQTLIADASHRPMNMENVAIEVGMSYSYFRRAFKSRTGVSPKQYHLQLRMRRVQDLLSHTALSMKEIAEALGYDSPFHLSADFRARAGMAPTRWRAEVLAQSEKAGK